MSKDLGPDQWLSRVSKHFVRRLTRSGVSLELPQILSDGARALAASIRLVLPWRDGNTSHNTGAVRAKANLYAQWVAYDVEAHVNPDRRPFDCDLRRRRFCRNRCPDVRMAAGQFLAAFDAVFSHFGWQTDEARASWHEATNHSVISYTVKPDCDVVMEQPPAAIEVDKLASLEREAGRLWRQFTKNLRSTSNPEMRKAVAVNALPVSTDHRAAMILLTNPTLSLSEVADAAELARGSLVRKDPKTNA